jgi:hypothetical protein
MNSQFESVTCSGGYTGNTEAERQRQRQRGRDRGREAETEAESQRQREAIYTGRSSHCREDAKQHEDVAAE